MKRDHRLVALSKEHHTALSLGRRLMAGGAGAALRDQAGALADHFAEEERRFLPLLHAHGRDALAARLRAEHAALDALFAAAMRGDREGEAGRALIDHVRFEESELFPVVETLLEAAP
ncbi:hemerythrin domain-containing protein [Thauera sinica]|uniref:Hemerythrin domain-containing protein n=1 Tax=Thauera sinica TaxID=2665146 RepID=A0ABW1ALE1_9RHOO|nr:hemerythrin domain-containing protein [Thauera sp. K11]ATE59148.1 hemerythrin HHE cation-binding protein [Thauera sp. K11]